MNSGKVFPKEVTHNRRMVTY